ncbi:hypothetical protein MKX01_032185 [Papaver californicum]|nr:hypothetical protein MKX01_015560 [Papaver californicum]KAI3981250.1 hypothetical protein MKX01_032185 [Papaver californicum]
MASIHDMPEMSPKEKEQVRKNLKPREELIRIKLILRERPFKRIILLTFLKKNKNHFKCIIRDEHKIIGYDWILI